MRKWVINKTEKPAVQVFPQLTQSPKLDCCLFQVSIFYCLDSLSNYVGNTQHHSINSFHVTSNTMKGLTSQSHHNSILWLTFYIYPFFCAIFYGMDTWKTCLCFCPWFSAFIKTLLQYPHFLGYTSTQLSSIYILNMDFHNQRFKFTL